MIKRMELVGSTSSKKKMKLTRLKMRYFLTKLTMTLLMKGPTMSLFQLRLTHPKLTMSHHLKKTIQPLWKLKQKTYPD